MKWLTATYIIPPRASPWFCILDGFTIVFRTQERYDSRFSEQKPWIMTQFWHQEIVIHLYEAVGQGFTLAQVDIFPFKDTIIQKDEICCYVRLHVFCTLSGLGFMLSWAYKRHISLHSNAVFYILLTASSSTKNLTWDRSILPVDMRSSSLPGVPQAMSTWI